MKISLDRKILGGFIMSSLVLVVVAFISIRNSQEFVDASRWVNHTHEVLYEFEQLMINAVDAESAARGFVLTASEDYLTPFETSRTGMADHLVKIHSLTIDNPVQQRNVEKLTSLMQEHRQHLEECIAMRRKDFETARALINTGESRRLLNAIRVVIQEARGMEDQLLSQRKEASDRDAQNFNVVFVTLLFVIVAVLAVVYTIIMANLRALRRAEREANEKNWTLEGTSELTRAMQGNKNMKDLCQEIIARLTRYLHTQVGAIYVTGKDSVSLRLMAAVALHKKENEMPVLSFGEGIAGQAAREKRMIHLDDVNYENLTVGTTFGQVQPTHFLAMPFLFEDRVAGVIELGSQKDFTEQHRKYLSVIADSIAIAITSCAAREDVKNLLEETQRQAEELEAQQHELRQANEELHAKTDLLETSEQGLKVQQEELQQTNIELEEKANMLEEQKQKLVDAKTEIERQSREVELSSRYKSEFLANMSHELRTPLNSILILAQLLAENKNKNLGDKEVDFARNIHTSGNGLLNLINEILDLSKIEAGKMELDIELVPVSDIVGTMQAMFQGTAENKGVTFEVSSGNVSSASITTDRLRVEQILRNLLSNAFKFTPKNGKVSLEISTPEIGAANRNTLKTGTKIIAFRVSDTGIGIPDDKRELIFQAFQQADGSTKRKYGGTGLGLSISRELSYALGGEIHLDSAVGTGSSFTLYLPLQFDPALSVSTKREVKLKERESVSSQSNREHLSKSVTLSQAMESGGIDDRETIREQDRVILILEDDDKFAKILLDFVRDRGYKGVIAAQGNTGLSFARHFRPIAILLDINLPVMDGNEVLRQIKNDPELRHIPVQIISAYDNKRQGLALGAFDYIQKPVSVNDLENAFQRIEAFSNKKMKKLLIVEDNEQQNQAIRELIGNGDVKSYSAYRGMEAYEMLEQEVFDCIIVDLGLPDMSGFDLMEKIRANPKFARLPIVVYTGRDLTKVETTRLDKLADTVVLKTVNSHERLLDETILFLHHVESKLPEEKQTIIRKLHRSDEILTDKKILLVDDDIRNIYSLTNALEEEGLICITAENGRIAIQTLLETPGIDLVLMDIMMPEMDGYEATTEIRKLDQFKRLPIIALTAKAMKGDKEKCLAVGMSDYVSKPVNLTQLLSLLRVWLYK